MSLAALSVHQLEALCKASEAAQPLTRAVFERVGLGARWSELGWLVALTPAGQLAVVRVALAERAKRDGGKLELVWTGPEAKVSSARDTAVVLRGLFAQASRSVLLAGYSFSNGSEIFEPLFLAMRDRGVRAEFFLHLDDRPGCDASESAQRGVEIFLHHNWPFGAPMPALYYDPRTVTPGSSINMHAKCVVIDDRWTLLGSANFTHNAHARNIELGALIEDEQFAEDVATQWRSLIGAKLVNRWVPRE